MKKLKKLLTILLCVVVLLIAVYKIVTITQEVIDLPIWAPHQLLTAL